MAKIPDPFAQSRPLPSPSGGMVSYRADSGAAAQRGETVARAGAMIAGVSENWMQKLEVEAKQEEDRINTLRAEEAFTKLRETQLDLTVGEENGFQRLKGGQAVNRPLSKEWGQRFEDASRDIESGLANDRQRELYRKRAGVARLQFSEEVLRHQVREGDVFAKEVFDGTVATELRNATAKWDKPNDVALSLERINAAISARAERLNWPKEYTEAVRLEQAGKVHSSVVRQALATGNYVFAQKWYEANKGDIDAPTAAAVQKAVEDGTTRQVFADFQREYIGAQNNPAALAELEKRVVDAGNLDDSRKNILLGRIEGRKQTLAHRAEIAYERQLRRVEKVISEVNASTKAGIEPTTEQLAPVVAAAKGTELEGEARRMVALANATRQFRNSMPAVQERMLIEAEVALRKDPGKFDRQVLEAWRSIHEGQKRAVQESPVAFAVRQGLVDPQSPAAQPLDLSQPNTLGPQLADRFALARAMRRTHGVEMKPLTAEETNLVAAALRTAKVTEKRDYFGALAQAAGGDYEGYSAIMAQLAKDEPVTAIAGEYAGKGRTQASDLILRGQHILRPDRKEDGSPSGGKLMQMPPEKEMRRIFDDTVREAYAGMPDARSHHEQAARAIYAALSSDAGDRDTSILDTDRWKQAIKLATGGIEKYRGKNIVLPYGFEYGQFRDGLARRTEDLVASGRLDASWTPGKLLDLPLESAGDGKYVFRAGDAEVVDKQGKRVIIDFQTSPAFRTSGYGLEVQEEEPRPAEIEAAAKAVTGRALPRKKAEKVAAK